MEFMLNMKYCRVNAISGKSCFVDGSLNLVFMPFNVVDNDNNCVDNKFLTVV